MVKSLHPLAVKERLGAIMKAVAMASQATKHHLIRISKAFSSNSRNSRARVVLRVSNISFQEGW